MLNEFFSLPNIMNFQVDVALLTITGLLLIFTCFKLIFSKSLVDTVIVMSVFSPLISLSYLLMDAPDVAMTEVAISACLSTCILLSFIGKFQRQNHVYILDSRLRGNDIEEREDDIEERKNDKNHRMAIYTVLHEHRNLIFSSVFCILFIIVLSWAGFDLPEYGDENSPMQTHVSRYYIENTRHDIGLPSFVAALLASYRGYDTLGETSVILIAGLAVLLLTGMCIDGNVSSATPKTKKQTTNNDFLRKPLLPFKYIGLFILPYILLYGFYIQFNGEISPGGGFQAGVIFASSLISFELVYGKTLFEKYFPPNLLASIAIVGVIIYAATGLVSFIFDENYLNYYSLASDKLLGQSIGIFAIELGVGLTVASVMCLIYSLFQEE